MKRFLLLISLMIGSTVESAPYLLNPEIQGSSSDRLSMAFTNHIAWEYATERFANDRDYYGDYREQDFTVQLCNEKVTWCVGYERVFEEMAIQLAQSTESLSYESSLESNKLYLQHAYSAFDVDGGVNIGLNEEGLLLASVAWQSDRFLNGTFFYDQPAQELKTIAEGNVNAVPKKFYSTYSGAVQRIGGSITYDWSSGFVTVDAQKTDQDSVYQGSQVTLSTVIQDAWYMTLGRSNVSAGSALYSENDTANELDSWSMENELHQYALGYKDSNNWSVGLRQESFQLSASANVQCANKNWGLSGLEQTLACVFVAPYAAFAGQLDYTYQGADAQRTFLFDHSKLIIGNGLGLVNWHSKYDARADKSSSEYQSGSEWLWVPSIDWQYAKHNWQLQYSWRQIVPIRSIRELFKPDGSSQSSGESGESNSNSESGGYDLNQDWLWPQVGGYHQLTLSYQW
ncbi:hypothetical protein DN730_15405 [Marinomonas piezotolerans]|uniref:Uncharacterized protein n=1 Tax=Marinomonas piezotolerans TaxID=2213058 RepID=A0A370U6F5_9GAMM|nr:hypothetical protein [Marinomonas piezotolerans]RDL43359.1 hypothetical protein DN730_15405 [Marinomonas piezotolerans]